MTETVNVVCLKWGSIYGPEYVNHLYNMVSRNLSLPFRFICLTEQSNGIVPDVEIFPLPEFLELLRSVSTCSINFSSIVGSLDASSSFFGSGLFVFILGLM